MTPTIFNYTDDELLEVAEQIEDIVLNFDHANADSDIFFDNGSKIYFCANKLTHMPEEYKARIYNVMTNYGKVVYHRYFKNPTFVF